MGVHGRDMETYLWHISSIKGLEKWLKCCTVTVLHSGIILLQKWTGKSSVMQVMWGKTAGSLGAQNTGADLRAVVVADRLPSLHTEHFQQSVSMKGLTVWKSECPVQVLSDHWKVGVLTVSHAWAHIWPRSPLGNSGKGANVISCYSFHQSSLVSSFCRH